MVNHFWVIPNKARNNKQNKRTVRVYSKLKVFRRYNKIRMEAIKETGKQRIKNQNKDIYYEYWKE